jgi:hypothetical protein
METQYALMPLSGEDAPHALALFTFTPEALLNLRSARKLVLDHDLLEIHLAPSTLSLVELVGVEPSESHREANPALDAAFAEAQDQGLANAPAAVADAAIGYEPDPDFGRAPWALAVVVTPAFLWAKFGTKYGEDFETRGLDLTALLGAPDEDNA